MVSSLIDIGVNLTDKAFHNDVERVINNAKQHNVNTLLITGTKLDELNEAIELCDQYPEHCYFTAGVHPHYSKYWTDESYQQLKTVAQHPRAIAVGEAGLDYNRNFSAPQAQVHAFEQQLHLAKELQMPIFLHERDAHDDQIKLLKQFRDNIPGAVAHCFTGTEQELKNYLELDLYIGITGWICDERRGLHLQELVHQIPRDRLLLETDAPYLLPRTLKPKPKSRKNEPAYLAHICEQVAGMLNVSPEELAQTTTNNAKRLFNLP